MILETLTATSPIDGRYRAQTVDLSNYFSEYALIKYRVLIEIEYFIFLHKQNLPQFSNFKINEIELREIYTNFSVKDAEIIKDIEKTTNHDVKAVEYFIKQQLEKLSLQETSEFVHFGLTSQDINNTAIPLSIKNAIEEIILPEINNVFDKLKEQANSWAEIPMLAKTHGQPASPTKLGKEWMVFCSRLTEQLNHLKQIPFSAKLGGATGNFNAHHLA
jgi:adenylosuccinate lyase